MLEEVVLMSAKVGLVKPRDHIVCVQRMGESFVIKIVSVNDEGDGVEIIRPKSLENLVRVGLLPRMSDLSHRVSSCIPSVRCVTVRDMWTDVSQQMKLQGGSLLHLLQPTPLCMAGQCAPSQYE